MTREERCPLSAMSPDIPTWVYPGGETRCLFSTEPDYAFQVVRGDAGKLLVFFQGGGLCWDQLSTTTVHPTPCQTSLVPQPTTGIFDRSNAANPFRKYTVVHIQYCSGDLHVGDTARWYLDPLGARVEQRGYQNAKAAIKWAVANVDADAELESLLLGGCSAGAVGVQLWAADLLAQLRFSRAAVLSDSYAGLFPGGGAGHNGRGSAEGGLLKDFGACKGGILQGVLRKACMEEALTVPAVFAAAMQAFPEVAFASINSKTDKEQVAVYRAIAQECLLPGSDLNATSYLAAINTILERYDKHPNYVSYVVTGDQHCYTPYPLLYTTDSSGHRGSHRGANTTPLADWLAALPVVTGGEITSECHGELLARAAWHGEGYCDVAQAGKVFPPTKARPPHGKTAPATSTAVPASASTATPSAGVGDAPSDGADPEAVAALLKAAAAAEASGRMSWAWYYWSLLVVVLALCYSAAVENGVPLPTCGLASRGPDGRKLSGLSELAEEEDGSSSSAGSDG